MEDAFISCVKQRSSTTINDRGTPIKSYVNSNILGYLGSSFDNNTEVAGKLTIETRYKFFSNDFDLQFGDFITYENKVYEVIGEPKNTMNENHHCRVYVKRIAGLKGG